MQKVTIVARTIERDGDDFSAANNSLAFLGSYLRKDSMVFSGKAAGICYMPDDYLSNGIQNDETALKRALGNAKSGHYSVFEHSHISFLIETTKAMAMVLNSTKLYTTSEKSARYTKMNPQSGIEKDLYEKWNKKLFDIIKDTYGDKYTDKEAEKLAMENARYFISVFTPTVMMFTVPFSRAILLCGWLDDMAKAMNDMVNSGYIGSENKTTLNYYSKLAEQAVELAKLIRESLSLSKEEPILVDHKDIGIDFFNNVATYRRLEFIQKTLKSVSNSTIANHDNVLINDFVKDNMYACTNIYSFACLAQEQRHRTLDYRIYSICEKAFYIPAILTKEEDIKDWNDDMNFMYKNTDVVCQGNLLFVHESGSFDNFYLKCKERVCMRAQKEIMDVTCSQILNMYKYCKGEIEHNSFYFLSPLNSARLLSMVDDSGSEEPMVLPRCMWRGYSCKEPCKHTSYTCTKDRLL